MRIAVLADVHGNAPALRAVLGELDRDPVDAIVVAGDVVGGPLIDATLELLAARPEPVSWVAGNCEREAVAVYDGAPASDDPPGRAAAWTTQSLGRHRRDQLAAWPISLTLGGVRFCHGSPRRDDEILTRLTPDDVLLEALSPSAEPLIVAGHTHQQMVRRLGPGLTYANAGSVGMPYEGRAGAFWMLVDDGVPVPRETAYDLPGAVAELRASGFPDVDEMLGDSLIEPADPAWVAAFFEHSVGRGPHPDDPPGGGG